MSIQEVEAFLAGFDDDQADIALELRELIFGVLDDPEERIYPGWRGLGYHTESGYVCGIFFADSGVRLGLEQGVSLDDPDGMLTGSGTQVRYLEIPDWTPQVKDRAEWFLRQTAGPRRPTR